MLQIQDLQMYHRQTLQPLIEDVAFIIQPGEKVALIGGEGSGKSSLLQWIASPEKDLSYVTI